MEGLYESGKWAFWVWFAITLAWNTLGYTPETKRKVPAELFWFFALVWAGTGLTVLSAVVANLLEIRMYGPFEENWERATEALFRDYVILVLLILAARNFLLFIMYLQIPNARKEFELKGLTWKQLGVETAGYFALFVMAVLFQYWQDIYKMLA